MFEYDQINRVEAATDSLTHWFYLMTVYNNNMVNIRTFKTSYLSLVRIIAFI